MENKKIRVDLRLDPQAHQRLAAAARADHRSLNSLVASIIDRWLADQERGEQ